MRRRPARGVQTTAITRPWTRPKAMNRASPSRSDGRCRTGPRQIATGIREIDPVASEIARAFGRIPLEAVRAVRCHSVPIARRACRARAVMETPEPLNWDERRGRPLGPECIYASARTFARPPFTPPRRPTGRPPCTFDRPGGISTHPARNPHHGPAPDGRPTRLLRRPCLRLLQPPPRRPPQGQLRRQGIGEAARLHEGAGEGDGPRPRCG